MYCTFEYPYKEINDRLYNIIDAWPKAKARGTGYSLGSGGQRTPWNIHEDKIDDIDKILKWLMNCIPNTAIKLGEGNTYRTDLNVNNYNLNEFKIAECWGILYDKGQNVVKHNHFPYCLSFVYFIKAPKGSSPLIIEGKRIKAEEGKLVMFHSSRIHWCNPSKVNGRCCLVGNIRY